MTLLSIDRDDLAELFPGTETYVSSILDAMLGKGMTAQDMSNLFDDDIDVQNRKKTQIRQKEKEVIGGMDKLGASMREPRNLTRLSGSSSGWTSESDGGNLSNLTQGRERFDKTAEENREALMIGKLFARGRRSSILSDFNQEVIARARALAQSRSDVRNLSQPLGIFKRPASHASVRFSRTPKMMRINEARSSAIGAVGVQFQADFNNSIGNRQGPLSIPVGNLIENFFSAYYAALNNDDLTAFSIAPQAVLIAASVFARTHLVAYIRPDSVTNTVYLERYARDHMNDV